MTDHPYQTLDSRRLWSSVWYNLRQDQVRFPDGSEGTYTVVDKRGGVWIVPVLSDGQMVLIRNYRYTIGDWLWEVPAGGISNGVNPAEMARLELAEEIGGTAERLEEVTTFFTMPGIGNELATIYLAHGVTLGEPRHEPSEVMERHIFPLDEVRRMIYAGEMMDGPSALAILLCLPLLTNNT